jgi:hypothetical protein
MSFITFFLLLINILVVFAIDVACWSIGWQLGLAGIIAIIAFVIAYAISEEAALSPRDFFWNSDWGIFCKKIKWAWGTALAVYAIAYIALAFAFGDILGVMN